MDASKDSLLKSGKQFEPDYPLDGSEEAESNKPNEQKGFDKDMFNGADLDSDMQHENEDQVYSDDEDEDDEDEESSNNWFSEYSASTKVVNYLTSLTRSSSSSQLTAADSTSTTTYLALDPETTSFLDLGTGNGHLLFRLREKGGFTGRMVGVDYSAEAVELARGVLEGKRRMNKTNRWDDEVGGEGEGDGARGQRREGSRDLYSNISFERWDILREPPGPWASEPTSSSPGNHLGTNSTSSPTPITKGMERDPKRIPKQEEINPFTILLDKGTFDAISLCADFDSTTDSDNNSTNNEENDESEAAKGTRPPPTPQQQQKRLSETYVQKIKPLLAKVPEARILVTSCNWTERELRSWFEVGGDVAVGGGGATVAVTEEVEKERGDEGSIDYTALEACGSIEYPSFVFGGVRGQSICSVVFRWRRGRGEGGCEE